MAVKVNAPIVVVASGRTGTNLLRSLIRQDQRFFNVGEFLNPTHAAGPGNFWGKPHLFQAREFNAVSDRHGRFRVLQDYVAELIAENPNKHVLADFKYGNAGVVDRNWRPADHTPDILISFMKVGANFIHLRRKNVLEQFCSHELAVETEIWVERVGTPKPKILEDHKIVVDTDGLVRDLQRIELRVTIADAWLENSNRVLETWYEDILVDGELSPKLRAELNELTGVELDTTGIPGTQKIAPPLKELIANYDEVCETLHGTEFGWCVGDGPEPDFSTAQGRRERVQGFGRGIRGKPRRFQYQPGASAGRGAQPQRPVQPQRKTILVVNELGAGLGHLMPIARIMDGLKNRDVRIVYAVNDLAAARTALGAEATILQAPTWPHHRHFGAASGLASYADVLTWIGFADARKLGPIVAAWSSLLDLVSPDVVVSDHSPGLLVALSGRKIPTVAVGSGFTMPPLDYERLPPLRGDRSPAIPEARLLEVVRSVLGEGKAKPGTLSEVFRTAARVVFALPELDPYASYRKEAVSTPPGGLPGPVDQPAEQRLFVYLGSETPNLDRLSQAIASLGVQVEAYVRGEVGPIPEFLRSRGAVVHATPPPLDEVLARSSHVMTQGGAMTSAAAYSAGRPQLVVPLHAESEVNLGLLQQRHVAHRLNRPESREESQREMRAFLADRGLADSALREARRLAGRTLPDGRELAMKAIDGILA